MANVTSAAEGALRAGADATKQAHDDLRGRIATVSSHVEALGGNFQGETAVAFNRLMMQWNNESTRVNNVLEDFEAKLRAFQTHMDAGEQEQSSAFARVAGRLGGGN